MRKSLIFLYGLITGSILFTSAMAFAYIGQLNVVASYSDIKMVVEGGLVKTSLEPFIIDGRVYVPLRAVAEALNKEVGWESNTVLVGTERQSLILTDLLKPTEEGLKSSFGTDLKVNNTTYPRGFYAVGKGKDWQRASMSFYVRGKGIKELSGSIGLDDANPENVQPVEIKILKDSTEVWKGTVRKGEDPLPVSFKLEDTTNSLYIQFSNIYNSKVNFIGFAAKY